MPEGGVGGGGEGAERIEPWRKNNPMIVTAISTAVHEVSPQIPTQRRHDGIKTASPGGGGVRMMNRVFKATTKTPKKQAEPARGKPRCGWLAWASSIPERVRRG